MESRRYTVSDLLQAAKAAEKAKPVAWRYKPMVGSPWSLSDDAYYVSCKRDRGYLVEPLYAAPAPVQQGTFHSTHVDRHRALHAAMQPVQHPLSDEQIDAITDQQWAQNNHRPVYAAHRAFARAIEAAHGIGEKT
jgi:hypothetical protein